jgi:hypothetical protein
VLMPLWALLWRAAVVGLLLAAAGVGGPCWRLLLPRSEAAVAPLTAAAVGAVAVVLRMLVLVPVLTVRCTA